MPLCQSCQSLQLSSLKSMTAIPLPAYGKIVESATQGCEGCRFFRDALHLHMLLSNTPSWELDPKTSVWLSPIWRRDWVVDLSINDPTTDQRTSTRIFQRHVESIQPRFLVSPDPCEDSCWNQIRVWMKDCESHGCRSDGNTSLPQRLVQVPRDEGRSPRLVETAGKQGKYVALSHSWGKSKMTKLLLDNEKQWKQAMEVSTLSRNFRDALTITRRLGFEYIWIDALCIVQDSPKDWATESPKMAAIYRNASLVVSATAAIDSEYGILNKRTSLCSPLLGSDNDVYFVNKTYMYDEYGTTRESPLSILDNLPLNNRGWAAQERIMARTILHYTTTEMFWECSQGCQSESYYPWTRQSEHRGNPPDPQRLFLRNDRLQPFLRLGEPTLGCRDADTENHSGADAAGTLLAWFACVSEFSHRDLTYPSDKLPAISGLAVAIGDNLESYLAGLWSKYLARSLAWEIIAGDSRKLPAEYRAPSWSWAAANGKVLYSWEQLINHNKPHWQDKALRAHSNWPDMHGPQFEGAQIVHDERSNTYMTPQKGSYLTLKGNCTSVDILGDALRANTDYFDPSVHADSMESWKIMRQREGLVCM
ncbi:uncharacterized protein PAC_09059 [Phialocephala subalpina]|uniref:Heterokaryon incompatibility domain-containing protein n=1 Tax=Phialocephala subalpina TaxID=576137 RepID=A0A1L7X2D6_9HELO|nr:uncharacterized protein PAC_09059 [Phialocephala subalpina]